MKIECECGWRGGYEDLAVKYIPNMLEPGDVIPEGVCPDCGSGYWDILEPAGSLKEVSLG